MLNKYIFLFFLFINYIYCLQYKFNFFKNINNIHIVKYNNTSIIVKNQSNFFDNFMLSYMMSNF